MRYPCFVTFTLSHKPDTYTRTHIHTETRQPSSWDLSGAHRLRVRKCLGPPPEVNVFLKKQNGKRPVFHDGYYILIIDPE